MMKSRNIYYYVLLCLFVVSLGMTGCNEEEKVIFSDGERLRTVRASELAYFRLSEIHWDSSYVYKVMAGNVQVGQVCREYLRTQDQELVAQAIVAYPMYRNKPDLSNGYIIQVNNENGSASTTVKHGGIVRWSATQNMIDYYREGEQIRVSDTVVYGGGGFGSPAASCGCGYKLELEPDILVDKRAAEEEGYKLVKIAKQYWMQENLRAEHLNDGTVIPSLMNVSGQVNRWYYENDTTYKPIYGGLYNWYCVETNRLAPIGYRVPSDGDWGNMEVYLGIDDPLNLRSFRGINQGNLLKSVSDLWINGTQIGTNITGFDALPGGWFMLFGRQFRKMGTVGYWWCSTDQYDYVTKFHRTLSSIEGGIGRLDLAKTYGFSVRCLKNE